MEKLVFVMTMGGVYGFVGIEADSNAKYITLKKALTLEIGADAVPYLGMNQLPAGYLDAEKNYSTLIPIKNIAYIVALTEEGHELQKLYEDFYSSKD